MSMDLECGWLNWTNIYGEIFCCQYHHLNLLLTLPVRFWIKHCHLFLPPKSPGTMSLRWLTKSQNKLPQVHLVFKKMLHFFFLFLFFALWCFDAESFVVFGPFRSWKKTRKGKRPGKGVNRFWKSIGFGFKTPWEAIKGIRCIAILCATLLKFHSGHCFHGCHLTLGMDQLIVP